MKNFSLDEALAEWRKSLNKFPGFEQGTAEELLSHVRDSIDDLVRSGMNEEQAFEKVTREKIGDLRKLSDEYYKAKSMKSLPPTRRGSSLASNFIKVALRNIVKNRPHSIINLAGLAIGLASVIAISVYVFSELSYDRFHAGHPQIYRMVNKLVRATGSGYNSPQGPPALAPALTTNFPELEYATRLRIADRPLLQYNETMYYEDHVLYADSSFFKVFDFEVLKGNPETALNQPNSIVLSETIAKKYFGEDDPINKIILMDGSRPLQVTAVIKDVPSNSHITFDILISFQTYVVPEGYLENLDSWVWFGFLTYVKTHEGVSISALEQKIKDQYRKADPRWETMNLTVTLQPLLSIYLDSTELDNPNNVFRVNSYATLYSLIAVGALIILIASFNYINLSIGMSMSRFKEIAVRKVLGSTKRKLVFQFILESVLYSMIALLVAVFLVLGVMRLMPDAIRNQLALDGNLMILYGIILIAFTSLVGMISGIFPALRLSSITSLELLKGTFKLKSGHFRNVLIGFQFALSASLVAISLVIGKQIEFFSSKDLGFVKEGIISINTASDQLEEQHRVIENMVRSTSGVYSLSQSSHMIGEGASGSPMYLPGQPAEEAVQMAYFQTDYEFLRTMGLELVEGRFFSPEFQRDSTETIILNETAVKTLGLTDPIGKRVVFIRGVEREVIGVVKDFHFSSLHEKIGSLAIIMPFTNVGNLIVRMSGDNIFTTLQSIESEWSQLFPNVPFEFRFMDTYLQTLYQKEALFASVIQFFSILATAIACLGLYSLAAISLASKVKQISIRRVLGAPIKDILVLSARSFVSLVIISCVLSWPLVMYVMKSWLDNFAYHIDITAWFFAVTFVITLLVTLITLSYHLFKAVTVNPAEVLRND